MIIEELKKKYGPIKENSYALNGTIYLFQKFSYRVEKGWYGFDLGPAPTFWALAIEDFLLWVETKCPDYKILQIKEKFNSLRMYLRLNCEDEVVVKEVDKEIHELEAWLFLK